jgi:hypothetical protein
MLSLRVKGGCSSTFPQAYWWKSLHGSEELSIHDSIRSATLLLADDKTAPAENKSNEVNMTFIIMNSFDSDQ